MISESKLKHSLGVARECERLAMELGKDEYFQNACFVMGFLHDVGYEKVTGDSTIHPELGYQMVRDFTFHRQDCLDAIYSHGTPKTDMSDFEYILNKADMTINHLGQKVSMEERVDSIKERHGESVHYDHAKEMMQCLKNYERREC